MEDAANVLERAVTLYQNGLYDQAHDLVMLDLETRPDHGKLWELCGIIRSAMSNHEGAVDALERASLEVPLSPAGQCVLAKCYAAAGHVELARQMYHHVFSQRTFPDRLLPMIAAGFSSVGETQLALEACRQAADCEIDSGQPLYGMAHYMERLNYPLELIVSVLQKAVELEPDRVRYRIALAKVYQRLGQVAEAYTALDGVRAEHLVSIKCANCLAQLASIYRMADDHEMAQCCQHRSSAVADDADDNQQATDHLDPPAAWKDES